MNLIDLSIKRPVFAWILMSALIIFGGISLSRLGVSQLPDVDFPILDISVNFEGASPELIETEILDPIEQRLLNIEGVKEMKSVARQGSGSVRLEFNINRNIDVALQEVQSNLSQLILPAEIDPPVIRKTNPEEDPIMILGVSSGQSLKETMRWIDNYYLDKIRFVPNIGEVSIAGFSARNLRVWIDPIKLKKHELTIVDVLEAISSQHRESAAGQFVAKDKELRVRWLGELISPEQFAEIRILKRGGQIVQPETALKIKDVARVEDGLSDIRRMARIKGQEAVFLSVKKQRGANEVDLSENIRKKMEELKPNLPSGFFTQVNIDFTLPTKATVHSTIEKLIVAGFITILVCFVFLGSLSSAINILFSIPTSIFGTFIILYFSGMTLNLFTLLALTLSISIVVDDAIMLLENIVRHYRMGKSPNKAASDGSKEILPSAIAASLSVVAIFLPVVFMDGIYGKFFFQFGIAMSAAILLSLLEAVTITPMRAAAFLSGSPKISKFEHKLDEISEKFSHAYRKILGKTLQWSKTVVIGSLAVFIVSLQLIKLVKKELLPPQDQNIILLTAMTPPGSSLDTTYTKSIEVENVIKDNPYLEGYIVSVGLGGLSTSVNNITIAMKLKSKETRDLTHLQLMDQFREKFKAVKGVRIQMRDISARGITSGRSFPIAFNLRGPDLIFLKDKSEELMKRLSDEKLSVDLDTDFKLGLPELLVQPKPSGELYNLGLTKDSVSKTLNAALGGIRQGRFTSDGKRFDIRIKIPDEYVKSEKDISNLEIRNSFGNLIPLERAVNMETKGALQTITRINRQRIVSVFGGLAQGLSQSAVLDKTRSYAKEILPAGYDFALEGAASGLEEAFKSLISALLVGIVVAYMILAIQFNSFIHPVVILVALPFSITGAFLALWLFGVSLNLFSFIGIIVLMGIAKKNSILLVEFTNQIRRKLFQHHKVQHEVQPEKNTQLSSKNSGLVKEALLEACPIRLRPILMTSVATVLAALPLVIGNSIGSETRAPMGLTIIGGSIVSTFFTLIVVPSLYLLLSRIENERTVNDEF
ncbi:MAG: efflux RND transporter permease subunit [Deltaproteobacteria bacterium]|nr:efflux RND transporter permease subunit [Deltaproteobacteria bacterium]